MRNRVVLPDMHAVRPHPACYLDAIVDDERYAQRTKQCEECPGLVGERALVAHLVAELHQRDPAAHGGFDDSDEVAAAHEHRIGDEISERLKASFMLISRLSYQAG